MQGLQTALVKGLGPAAQGALAAAQLLLEEPDGSSGGSSGGSGGRQVELGVEGQGRGRGAGRVGRTADRQMAGGPTAAAAGAVGEAALKVRKSKGLPCVLHPSQMLIRVPQASPPFTRPVEAAGSRPLTSRNSGAAAGCTKGTGRAAECKAGDAGEGQRSVGRS